MQFKKVLIFTVCFMIGGFAVDLFASETNNYKNRLILGGRLNALDTTSEYNEDDYKIANNIELEDIGVSFELNAKYKIYFNKAEQNSFFIAPEVFYSFGSVKSDDAKFALGEYYLKISPSYGAKISLGYELKNKHAFSVGLGFQNISYKYEHFYRGIGYVRDDDTLAGLFSFEYEYNINNHLVFNFGFTCSYFEFRTPDSVYVGSNGFTIGTINKINNTIFTAGIGLGYRF